MNIRQFDLRHDGNADQATGSQPVSSPLPLPDNVVPMWNTCSQPDEITDYDLRNVYL